MRHSEVAKKPFVSTTILIEQLVSPLTDKFPLFLMTKLDTRQVSMAEWQFTDYHEKSSKSTEMVPNLPI